MQMYINSSAGPMSLTITRTLAGSYVITNDEYGVRLNVGKSLTFAAIHKADRKQAEKYGELPWGFTPAQAA